MRLKLSLLMFWDLDNLRNGFAARCAAVASPRRSASTLARAVPLVRACPLYSQQKQLDFTQLYYLTARKLMPQRFHISRGSHALYITVVIHWRRARQSISGAQP